MSITVNIYYTGKDGAARKFAEEMISGHNAFTIYLNRIKTTPDFIDFG